MDELLFNNYIRPTPLKNINGFSISKSEWSGPNDLGFYFRYIEIHNLQESKKIHTISESLHVTINNKGYVINLIQVIKNNFNKMNIQGSIEYHTVNKLLKFKSLNKNYFNFIDLLIII